MQKIIAILLVCSFFTGCSVLKKEKSEVGVNIKHQEGSLLTDRLSGSNLSNRNFYLQKAEVELKNGSETEKFIASWRYVLPGNSLISFRTRTGIEIARIYITPDTIMVNDRINRILYSGKPEQVKRKYGISAYMIPLLLGDFIKGSMQSESDSNCAGGILSLSSSLKGVKTNYVVNCGKERIVETSVFSSDMQKILNLEFYDFKRREGGSTASKILIKSFYSGSDFYIKIDKLTYPWDGEINFVPGNRYEHRNIDQLFR